MNNSDWIVKTVFDLANIGLVGSIFQSPLTHKTFGQPVLGLPIDLDCLCRVVGGIMKVKVFAP
jgi:hypothetical protein